MARSILYVGDQLPVLTGTITTGAGSAVNLTGYTVQFTLRGMYEGSALFTGPGTATSPTTGAVSYSLGTADLASAAPGLYEGRWIVTNGTKPMNVPAGEFEIRRAY